MPVPVSWWVHSLSLYFCIIITSKRSTLRRTSCYFWWSLSQLSSFTRPLASSYTPEKVLSHVVSWCDCHGMPYWRHRSEYSRYPDEVWRRLSKRSNSQFRRKKKRKENKKRHLLNLIPVGFGLINVSCAWKSHMGREILPFVITLKCCIFQPTWPYTSQLAADPRY